MMFKNTFIFLLIFAWLGAYAEHDPTSPVSGSDSSSPYKIEGIFVTSSKRLVLISGHYYVVGDEVNGGKIVAILKDRIVVETAQGKKVYPLTLKIRKSR